MNLTETEHDQQLAAEWARELLANRNFIILDTETTGLGNWDEIVQIGVINSNGETVLDTLVRPNCSISDDAIAIHGIDYQKVANAQKFDQVFLELMRAIGNRDVVIYNAQFDLRLIKQSMRSNGIQLAFPTSDRRQCQIFTNGGSIHCAMLQYSQFCGQWNDYHQNYRWQKLPGGDHSAIGDCRATLEVIKRMAEASPQPTEQTLDDVPF